MAVLLACASAFLFGAMTVALRFALGRCPEAELGTLVTTASAFAVSLLFLAADPPRVADWAGLGVFALGGVLAPGSTQVLFTLAVRDAGPSRASAMVATAPLIAVALALTLLGEPPKAPLLVGAALVVAGGVVLVGERDRPEHFKLAGLGFALAGTGLIAGRDNVVRWASHGTSVAPLAGNATALLVGVLLAGAWTAAARGRRMVAWRGAAGFVPVGVLFGLSYVCLFEAYYRGRVTVVSPIVATEALWTVGLSALLLRRHELIGRRLVLGAVCVVAGGALIGAFR